MEKFTIIVFALFISLISYSQTMQERSVGENDTITEKASESLLLSSITAPDSLVLNDLILLPLVPDFCKLDYAAISSNIEYLKGTFGPDSDWPEGITYDDNLIDLKLHEELFEAKIFYAYSVFTIDRSEIIGCVYILPINKINYDVSVTYWVTEEASKSGIDTLLYYSIKLWLKQEWQFKSVAFPGRDFSYDIWHATK